jgi:ribose 5-phosphate isomerase B
MENKKRIIIGSDHAGYDLKENIKKHLTELAKFEIIDVGTESRSSVDFPDYAERLSLEVLKDKNNLGIVCCGSGIGVSISCNKIPGIRCALVHDYYTAKMSRQHTDCNVIAIGGSVVGSGVGISIVDAFLEYEFLSEEKYQRRIDKITDLEKRYDVSNK